MPTPSIVKKLSVLFWKKAVYRAEDRPAVICLKMTFTWWRRKIDIFNVSFCWRHVKTKNWQPFMNSLYKHADFVPRNQGNWETGNAASMPTLYLYIPPIVNHNQSEKTLSLFSLLRMLLLSLLRCISTRQTEPSRFQAFFLFRAFKSSKADTQKCEGLSSVRPRSWSCRCRKINRELNTHLVCWQPVFSLRVTRTSV